MPTDLNISGGHALYFRTGTTDLMWIVYWKNLVVQMRGSDQKNIIGEMSDPNGDIYRDAKVVCTFQAKRGHADRETKILELNDQVKIVAQNPAAILTCDHLTYDGAKKFFKAKGNVRITGSSNSVGTLDEVWATPDLKRIATPDMFNNP